MPYKDPEKKRKANLESYHRNKERNKDVRLSRAQTYWETNPVKRLLIAAKTRAKKYGLEFDLDESDITIPTHCPYLGIELTSKRGLGRLNKNSMALDRVDNSKGYIKGNVQVISFLANNMKHTSTIDELVSFAKGILKLHT